MVAVIPARDEAESIAPAIGSLLRQDYPGELTVVLVDDDSDDATVAVARAGGVGLATGRTLDVIRSRGLPAGWTGKLWALQQGVEAAAATAPEYLLLTDADIVHVPDSVRSLVARAEDRGLVMASLMARLRCVSAAERVHVPAFVYFFQMLFPFAWVNDPHHATAAAAGGCILVRGDALRQIGGVASIRGALIDDCTLAERLKAHGPIWLGLTERVDSIRRYETFEDNRRMISRSAYAQLKFSPILLAGTVLGMALIFLAGPLLAIFGEGLPRVLGLVTWALMALSFQPMLRFYRVSPLWGLALPVIALLYLAYTLDSALQYARGRGGQWKGRVQANASQS